MAITLSAILNGQLQLSVKWSSDLTEESIKVTGYTRMILQRETTSVDSKISPYHLKPLKKQGLLLKGKKILPLWLLLFVCICHVLLLYHQ